MKARILERKAVNKIIRMIIDGRMTRQEAYVIGFKESQIQHLVDQRIANEFKPSISIYQCLVSERPSNIDLSKTTRDRYNRLCLPIFGRPTPLFNY